MNSKQVSNKDLTVFISGLPYVATEDEVRNFFYECGTIEYFSSVLHNFRDLKLPKYQDTGRLLGYGHVTFSTQEERDAVKL
jgi:RNA recognition motif-containing protein